MQDSGRSAWKLWKILIIVYGALFSGCEHKIRSDVEVNAGNQLTEEMKTIFRDQLKIDPEKEFGPEFIRTTDFEIELIDKYGFEAVKLIFENSNSANYFELGKIPADCPWVSLNGKSLEDAIGTVFDPVQDKIPKLMSVLKARCKFLYVEKKAGRWTLHYFLHMALYDERRYFLVYTGGAPNSNPEINDNLVLFDWHIPSDLRDLYSIHDGFGPILDCSDISVMAEMMDPICKEQNTYPEGYHFRDLLEFYPDEAGNSQCFLRNHNKKDSTVDWDHEVWEISGEIDFFDFIDERMSQIDEE